jgi:hypothetical protein
VALHAFDQVFIRLFETQALACAAAREQQVACGVKASE